MNKACFSTGPIRLGPLTVLLAFDMQGHWIIDKNRNTSLMLLWAGTTRKPTGTVYNLILGPIGVCFCRTPKVRAPSKQTCAQRRSARRQRARESANPHDSYYP